MRLITHELKEVAILLDIELSTVELMNQELIDRDIIQNTILTKIENKSDKYSINTLYSTERNTFGIMWDFDKTYDENESAVELTMKTQRRLHKNS